MDEYVDVDEQTLGELSQYHEELELHRLEREVEEELFGSNDDED